MIPEQLILTPKEIDRLKSLCSNEPGVRRGQIQIWFSQFAREFDQVMTRQFYRDLKTTWVGFAWRCVIDGDPYKQLPEEINAIFTAWTKYLGDLQKDLLGAQHVYIYEDAP